MIEVDVKVKYDRCEKRLTVAIDKGITLVLGEVGSFKSTLLKVIGGVKIIEDGAVILDGTHIEELTPKERDMMLVSKETLPPAKKVGKALVEPLLLRGYNKKEARRIAGEAAERFGLDPNGLVASERRKFFEARMSLRSTKVTMFDEPYHFFGEDVSEMIRSRLSDYVIVTSSDGEDARKLVPNEIVVIRGGDVLQSGTFDEVKNAPISKYVDLLVNM